MTNFIFGTSLIRVSQRALFAMVAGGLLVLVAGQAKADLIGFNFVLTKAGGNFDTSYQYGIENKASGNTFGVSAFESTGGNGYNFFVYFADNAGSPDTHLKNHNGGVTLGWGGSGLAAAFPPTGMTSAPTIRALIPGVDRNSTQYGAISEVAPDGGMFVQSFDSDSFTLGISDTATISNGAKVGYEITLHAVPEPSTVFLLGMGTIGLIGLRRKRRIS
ncbi:MAG: PEP-CTERM sorting domain-containing protein [Pirellulaceae bacterium]